MGALRAAQRLGPGHTIVTLLCDGGQRYMSTVHAAAAGAAEGEPQDEDVLAMLLAAELDVPSGPAK